MNKKVSVLLFGGSGNRLFQYARAKTIKSDGGKPTIITLPFQNFFYQLANFTPHKAFFNETELARSLDLKLRSANIFEILIGIQR